MKNCSKRLHSDQRGMKNENEKGPNPRQTKKAIHAHKYARISSEQPGYFHIYNNNNNKKQKIKSISCKNLCCFGFTINFNLRESTHTAKQGTHDALLQTCSPDISSRLTFFFLCLAYRPVPSVLCMREGSLDRNVRDAENRTFQRVSKFSRLNPPYCGAINTKMFSFHSSQPQLP